MPTDHHTPERIVGTTNGWLALSVTLGLFLTAIVSAGLFVRSAALTQPNFFTLAGAIVTALVALVACRGFFTLQPNNAAVLVLFGQYQGTVKASGFHWANPFNTRLKISQRSRNFNGPTLKVNDRRGNPIEIGAVVVWRVSDTAKAIFDVDYYATFVEVQSESALRHLANSYAYDDGGEDETTLRSDVDEVSSALQEELMARLSKPASSSKRRD